ncbi:MAG: hypothetical protein HC879_10490 [Leptolyngbyaceae cyanobacterium SL_5_9]|nr:hypothetical protein [Leptolyngbyaceae cyanobacterium SL_5_9]NJO75318.1 hypothetical protein [Leptolyngbyaceae cyanobacterium RM1_406_9]
MVTPVPATVEFDAYQPNSSGPALQERVVERVVKLAEKWLVESPTQVVKVVEQQARQLLAQREEIARYQEQVAQLQQEVQRLQEPLPRSAAPFAIAQEKRQKTRKRPGRAAGHPGQWRTPPRCCPQR